MKSLQDLVSSLSTTDFYPVMYKRDGEMFRVSSQELHSDIINVSKAFLSYGLQKGDKVALFANNHPRWISAVLGINQAGLVDVPRGTDSSDAQLRYILEHSQANFVIVEDEKMLSRVKSFAPPNISQIVTLENSSSSLKDFSSLASSNTVLAEVSSDDLASIIYTSGTTGNPKGVMLSHKNYISNVLDLQDYLGHISHEKFLSLLPPWHSFGRGEKHLALITESDMFYTNPKNFVADAKEQAPSFIVSVPRLWETVYDKLQTNPKLAKVKKIPIPFLKKFLISSSLRKALGGNVRYIISGGGGLPAHIDTFFLRHGVEILEGYGMTEMAPVISARTPSSKRSSLQTVGKPMNSVSVQIRDENNIVLPAKKEGVLFVNGPNKMKGYYKNPQETKAVIGEDGYVNTGDTGYITSRGNIVITGRQKEEIVLSNGQNIQPKPLEDMLKSHPLISDAVVVGEHWDSRSKKAIPWKKLGALIVPHIENLKKNYADFISLNYDHQVLSDKVVKKFFQEEVKKLFDQTDSFSAFERVYGVELIKPLRVGYELTNSYKLRRGEILKNYYKDNISQLSQFLQ